MALLQPLPASSLPRRGGPLTERFGQLGLRLFRFRFAGDLPDVDRCVMIVAPHTSNWDFPLALCGMFALRLRASWLGKHTIFVGPLGALWRWMGGVPVDRSRPDGVVEAAVERLRTPATLGLAPEGTRKAVPRFKSGFLRIAVAAGVPIAPVALDWGRRELRFLPLYWPTGDIERDLDHLQGLFDRSMARRPENYGVRPC